MNEWKTSINWSNPNPTSPNPRVNKLVQGPLPDLLAVLQQQSPSPLQMSDDDMAGPSRLSPEDTSSLPHEVTFNESDITELQRSDHDLALERLGEELNSYLFDESDSENSDNELEERGKYISISSCMVTTKYLISRLEQLYYEEELYDQEDPLSFGQRRSRMNPSHQNPEWFPWPDKAVRCAPNDTVLSFNFI